jgi:uncharacterized protein (DUF697 family)/tellurite resistance protein
MTSSEQSAVLTICLMAAFADSYKDDREREQIKQIADSLGSVGNTAESVNTAKLYQDVLLKRVTLEDTVKQLVSAESKNLAYEMAVHVINADHKQKDDERAFLAKLSSALGLSPTQASAISEPSDALADAAFGSYAGPGVAAAGAAAVAATPSVDAAKADARKASVDEAELDKTILNASILNGALELLPQSWATMAIIPLQTRLVYNIGKQYGYTLDAGHIKEFLATVGVGMASQYVEQAGRKLIGGLFGKAGGLVGNLAGSLLGSVGRNATGAAFSFASTYALGQLAKRYYSGGRTMSTAVLKDTFQTLLAPAKNLQQQYAPHIAEKARSVNMSEILSMVKGGK